jgi:WS/DGAT/MGAT family acyltransferase
MPNGQLTRRLTTLDASFLYSEKPNMPTHIGSIGVYEGHLSREDVVRVMEQRMHLLPRYRQKAVFPPFGVAHPTWEDDPNFDVRNHVEEVTLPPPGDDQVLSEVGGRVFAPPLPRDRPLWKLVLIQGRADGNTALASLVSHAMVDGVSGVDLTLVMHDLTPDAAPPAPPAQPWQPAPLPDQLTLLEDAVRDSLVEAARRWTNQTFEPLRPRETAERTRRIMGAITASMPQMLQPAPRMPFNGPISGERSFAWASFSFAEVRAIRSVLGGTMNDVVLAVIAGALGRYLRAHNVPTAGVELRTMCPVSMRRSDERGQLGNLVSVMIAPLYVGIDDPVERLRAERTAMERLKEADQAGGFYAMTQQGDTVPPAVQAFFAGFDVPDQTFLNTVTTNVPGPQIPLYMDGRKLLAILPVSSLLGPGIGLFHAIVSYNQVLSIGANVEPRLVPDPWFYADCLKESFAELREAAEQAAPATGAPSPSVAVAAAAAVAEKPARARKPARRRAAATARA